MTTTPDLRSVFDYFLQDSALQDLTEVRSLHAVSQTPSCSLGGARCSVQDVSDRLAESESRVDKDNAPREVSSRLGCSTCQCPFDNREEQMEHYKLDWHRFNLKQRLAGQTSISVEEFERKTGAGDMSSISGSEEDEDLSDQERAVGNAEGVPVMNDNEVLQAECYRGRSNKVVFQNSQGQYLVLHRCVLQSKTGLEEDVLAPLRSLSQKTIWVILMTGGGHFAGAVFQGKEVLQHKTFHRYTVRAKRGTAQGLRDAKNSSHTPKSAGAALRRYNEAALVKDVQVLLNTWLDHLTEATAIFLRAPGYNTSMFFSGKVASLDKKDPRIRILPFPTRRATFREIKRVHEVLSTLQVFEKDTEISDIFSPKKVWKKTAKVVPEPETSTAAPEQMSSGEEVTLETVELTLGTLDLREHEIYLPRTRKRRKKKKKDGCRPEVQGLSNREAKATEELDTNQEVEDTNQEVEDTNQEVGDTNQEIGEKNQGKVKPKILKTQHEEELDEWEYALRDMLFTACKTGDQETLISLLRLPGSREERNISQKEVQDGAVELQGAETRAGGSFLLGDPVTLLNRPIDSSGFTLLHVASAAGQKAAVRLLMESGSDPACRDKRGRTPYIVAPEKDTRNVFRKYMAEHPGKYDYGRAQVPGPLTAELEAKKTEKKKAQKAAKKQREKELKEERRVLDKEEEEKRRFASLSDREKRALAAEKRLADQKASIGVNLSNTRRCWQCGESLVGKVPFQYLDFSFCTPGCVQEHRRANVTT